MEGPMKHAHFKLILAAFSLIGACDTAIPVGLAGEFESGCDCGRNRESSCCVCRICDCCSFCCDRICQYRAVDGCTKCAWSRTWNAPNALATPLRQYYVPRPPQCCWYSGCAARYGNAAGATWDMPCNSKCQDRQTLASTEVPPDAIAVSQFERLGKLRNELDVVGPMGGAAPGGAAAPRR
jgi:hypothetical protein